MDSNPIHHPSAAKEMKYFFYGLHSTSDDWPGWVMDSNPIHHPSPAKKNEMLVFGLRSFLMICLVDWWTWTSSATPLLPKKWNAQFSITLNFWWSAKLINWLKFHLPTLSSQINEMLIFVLCWLWMISQAGRMTQTPFTTRLLPKKWNAHFCITFNIWCWPDWSMDLNLIHHSSPAKNIKCSFLGYVNLLMISWAVRWTQTQSATPLQPIKWNTHFWITFNFWWSAGLIGGLKPHSSPLSTQKNEILIFWLCSTSDDQLGWSMDLNPNHHLSPAKEMKCSFLYYVQLLMIGWAVQWTRTPSTTPLQPKQWNAHFCITFNIWCWPDWSMDLNLIHHSSPAKNMKWSFLGYIQLLMISQAVRWTQTPSASPLQLIKWNAHFCITFNFWWSAGLIGGLKPHSPPLSSQKNEMLIFWLCSTSDDQLIWSMDLNPICHPSPIKKNEMLIFVLHSTSDDQLSWSVDSNPIHQPSPANKMKYSFLDYVQLLMISWAGQWT